MTGEDLALVEEVAARVTAERGAFRADQFHLEGNPAVAIVLADSGMKYLSTDLWSGT